MVLESMISKYLFSSAGKEGAGMKAWVRILPLLLAGIAGNLFADHIKGDDPVSLVEDATVHIFADVTENLEHYTDNPEALQTLVRTDLMPLLDVDYAARLVLGHAGRGYREGKNR